MYIEPSYWRPSLLSINLYPCDPILSYCIGGNDENLCGIGYTGPICKTCDY